MKKIFLFASLVMATMALQAQPGGGGMTRRTPEERAARVHQKLDSAFKLEATKLATLDSALITLYKAQDAKMQEIFQNSGGDRDAMRETMTAERKKYADAEEEMIKAMLTEDQFKTWKDVILPAMRPQRPLGGGGPGGGNN
jgi:hypothetical protein